jgi:FdhD protein
MHKVFRFAALSGEGDIRRTADLILETPIEITVEGHGQVFVMFTPVLARELVTGFLFTEGMIETPADIKTCDISRESGPAGEELVKASVRLAHLPPPSPGRPEKRVSYSSCGICGKDSYDDLSRGLGRVKSRHRFSLEALKSFLPTMKRYQPLYRRTGGAHAAILLDDKADVILHCEDLGRHNALDKLIGCALIQGISLHDKVVVSSGRASLEMILKTTRAGGPVFVAMSRPTSRAVEAARFYNITLMDMAKGSHRIYSHARRIQFH